MATTYQERNHGDRAPDTPNYRHESNRVSLRQESKEQHGKNNRERVCRNTKGDGLRRYAKLIPIRNP